ncbi:fimbrial protein [Pseudomonas guariconensis]|uniref:fimbrial protein n=1 Tax=Pseudomonas guariconensis TaxID=1288410 RepID=UPI0018A88B88|nr:fimbrial protein [Pseudomonas guariconensis]MBF8722162.1 fimbrial protein [Pseudomonas guariconensis]MBF8791887.1 fimbrial protein [Pseudomonas monteilii]
MNKTLIAIALGLASTTVFADTGTGTIYFQGKIEAGGTCPISVVGPGSSAGGIVRLGEYRPGYFTASGTKTNVETFYLHVDRSDPGCDSSKTKATFQFESAYGAAGTGGKLYGIKSGPNTATNLAVSILDQNDVPIDHATAKEIPITSSDRVKFGALMESTGASVGAGGVDADVKVTVTLS